MAYDSNTYGASPFSQTAKRPPKLKDSPLSTNTDLDPAEALSDQGSELRSPDAVSADDIPALPAGYAPVLKSRSRSLSRLYIPKGRISGLNLLGESLGWLMAWGTVGFFRAYVPPPIVTLFDHLFSPWGMTALTLTSALLIGQLLKRYQLKLEALRLISLEELPDQQSAGEGERGHTPGTKEVVEERDDGRRHVGAKEANGAPGHQPAEALAQQVEPAYASLGM